MAKYDIGNSMIIADPNTVKFGKIKETIKLLDKKIDTLKGNKANTTLITKLRAVRRDFEVAYNKLRDYFLRNPDKAASKNTTSLADIGERVERTARSSAQTSLANAKEGLSVFGYALKLITGVALSLTGVGLIVGIPLLRNAKKHREMLDERAKNKLEIQMELEDKVQSFSDKDSTYSTVYAKGKFSQEQLDYLLDHPNEFNDLMKEATGSSSTLGLTTSQRVNLLSQLQRVKEMKDPSKNTALKSAVQSKDANELGEKVIGIKDGKTDAQKDVIDQQLHYIITGKVEDVPEEAIASMVITTPEYNNYRVSRAAAESSASVTAKGREKTKKQNALYSELKKSFDSLSTDKTKMAAYQNLKNAQTANASINSLPVDGGAVKNVPKTTVQEQIKTTKQQLESLRSSLDGKGYKSDELTNLIRSLNNFETEVNSAAGPDLTFPNTGGAKWDKWEDFHSQYSTFYTNYATLDAKNKTTPSITKKLSAVISEALTTSRDAARDTLTGDMKAIFEAVEKGDSLSPKQIETAKQAITTSGLSLTEKAKLVEAINRTGREYLGAKKDYDNELLKDDSYKKAKEAYDKARCDKWANGMENAAEIKAVAEKLKKSGMAPEEIEKKIQEMQIANEFSF